MNFIRSRNFAGEGGGVRYRSISYFIKSVVLRRIDLTLRQIDVLLRSTQNLSRTRRIDNRVLLAE